MTNGTLSAFNLEPGAWIADKYEVVQRLGAGWEGEVYLVREKALGIERTAKLFFPQRNLRDRQSRFYARKLHKLRHCPIVIQYHTQEEMPFEGYKIRVLVSEFVHGELLAQYVKRQPGGRLQPFVAFHLLHALAAGIDRIHRQGEYHGDLHDENVIVQRLGLRFDLKLLDMFPWGKPRAEHIHRDVLDLIRIFYDATGGARFYPRQPPEVKAICCGLKRSLILKKFRTAGKLREYLERMEWQ